jgi:DNA-binding NarL/FixJ family response regulator
MIVDDHAAIRGLLRTLLQTPDTTFAECEDGQTAINLYPEFRPDLVLMDIAMKGLDGVSTTTRIKAQFPDARIWIVTGYDDQDLREAAQKAGACGYLLKDDLSQLRALVSISAAIRPTTQE